MIITFDRKRFTSTKAHGRRQVELERMLLCAGVPFTTMRHFLGFTWEELTARRKTLGLQGDGIDRPVALAEASIGGGWKAWRNAVDDSPTAQCGPGHYLAVHRATGLPLPVIRAVLQQQ